MFLLLKIKRDERDISPRDCRCDLTRRISLRKAGKVSKSALSELLMEDRQLRSLQIQFDPDSDLRGLNAFGMIEETRRTLEISSSSVYRLFI